MNIILALFSQIEDVTINRALLEIRDCKYLNAITLAVIIEDFRQQFYGVAEKMFTVIQQYLLRFPSDTAHSNGHSIRMLHKSLKIWFHKSFC